MYTYRIVKECSDGSKGKRTRIIDRSRPLKIGGLYVHLGYGFNGAYRVLEQIVTRGEK